MNAKETVMDAARMGFVQIRRDHTTATVTVGTAVMVGIVQVLTTNSLLWAYIQKRGLAASMLVALCLDSIATS